MKREDLKGKGKFVNLMVDWAFKRAFGTPANAHILLEFINDLFEGYKRIESIEYINPEILPNYMEDRGCIIDILCRDEKGDKYIIEMQVAPQEDFHKRVFYYGAKVMSEELQKGDKDWTKIKGVFCISLMNFTIDKLPLPRTDVYFIDNHGETDFYDFFRMVFIQIPRYNINSLSDACSNYERWLYLLSKLKDMDKYPEDLKKHKEAFRELLKLAEIKQMTPAEKAAYDYEVKQYDYYIASMEYKYEKGVEEGMKAGMEKGIEKEKKEIAIKMKEAGISIEDISNITGLTVEEIENFG